MSLSLALLVEAIEKKERVCPGTTLRRVLRGEKRAVVKFIVVVVAPKGEQRRRASRLCLVDCQNSRSLCRFYSRSARGRYEREIQALPGAATRTAGSGLFLGDFFKKSRTLSVLRL